VLASVDDLVMHEFFYQLGLIFLRKPNGELSSESPRLSWRPVSLSPVGSRLFAIL